MRVVPRRTEGVVILDLHGPFPDSIEGRSAVLAAIRGALAGRTERPVIALHGVETVRALDVGLLRASLREAGVAVGALGAGPRVAVVAASQDVRRALAVVDSPFVTFSTVEDALSHARAERDD